MTAHITALRSKVEHAAWANRRIGEALVHFGKADARMEAWFAHIVTTERLYFERLMGLDPWPQDFWPRLSVEACLVLAAENSAAYDSFLAGADSATLTAVARYRDSSGAVHATPVGEMLEHVGLHGAYHRGQIAARLRRLGGEPAATDYIVYVRTEGPFT